MEADLTHHATEAVEWLAALWELTGPMPSRSANPHLVALLRDVPAVLAHPALAEVARVRESTGRDALIKSVVRGVYDRTAPIGLDAALAAFVAEVEGLLGPTRHAAIAEARAAAQQAAAALAGPLDPAGDVARLTGERVALRAVLAPSVFLPPPGAGRHSVLVRRPDGSFVAHLHFGFPLLSDPRQVALNRTWLLGGAWHYAIQLALDRHWPAIAARLTDRPDLRESLHAVIAAANADRPFQTGPDGRPWTDALAAHLNIAIKCVMAQRLGLPDYVHRDAAIGQGCVLSPWLEAWLLDGLDTPATFAAHLATLPDALAAGRADWERLAAAATMRSTTCLGGVLGSPEARCATIVLPDEWSAAAADAAALPWHPLSLPTARYSDWRRTAAHGTRPVIAIGEPARHPLVRRVLDQRGLRLSDVRAPAPAIVALSLPDFPDAPWCIAVAVTHPETAADLRADMVSRRINPYIVLGAGLVIDTGHADRPVRAATRSVTT
jgi:hypothetical protein